MKLCVVPLGQTADDLTLGALRALREARWVCLRTGEAAAAALLTQEGIAFEPLDQVYLHSADFDALQGAVGQTLLERLNVHESVAYGVADPLSDATVEGLRRTLPPEVELCVLPGVGLGNRVAALGLVAFRQADCTARTEMAATALPRTPFPVDLPLVVVELASQLLAGEVKLALLDAYGPDHPALYVHGMGAEQAQRQLSLSEIDRQAAYDHTTALFIPPAPLATRRRYDTGDLAHILRILRGPGGCPWDREQTHESLRSSLIEEAYEAVDAITGGDPDKMADELGDVLLQVVFHAEIGRQEGSFTLMDVTSAICRKMITRHAHIFGEDVCETTEDVLQNWDAIKRRERGQKTTGQTLRGVAGYLPALLRADKVQGKARRAGFDWADAQDALEKVREEAEELEAEIRSGGRTGEEGGDLLFAVVNVLRLLGVDSELALSAATEKFVRRFESMERMILAEGKQMQGMTLPEMDVYWERVKKQGV